MKFVRIGDIITITSGGTPSTSNRNYYDAGQIHWVKTGDLKVKDLINIPGRITQEGLSNSSAKIFPINTVLIAMYGATIGNCSILKTIAATNQACAALLPNKNVDPDYLYFYLQSIREELVKKAVGGGQPNISAAILKDTKIPLPSIKVQTQITKILNNIYSLIEYRKETLPLLDEYLKSTFLEFFGNPISLKETISLSDIATIEMGQSPPGDSYNSNGKGVALLNGPTEFGTKYPIEQQWTTKPTRFCKTNDILFCVRGATAGRMNFADKSYCIGRGLAAIRTKGEVSNEFIYYFLNFHYNFFQKSGTGSTFINISKDKLTNLKVPRTNRVLQERFIQTANKIESLKIEYRAHLQQLVELNGALTQLVFKNELSSQIISDPLEIMDISEDHLINIKEVKNLLDNSWEDTSEIKSKKTSPKTQLEDIIDLILQKFQKSHFTFENFKNEIEAVGVKYDFGELRDFIFELLDKNKLQQFFADATYKTQFKENDLDYEQIKELSEQIYLKVSE